MPATASRRRRSSSDGTSGMEGASVAAMAARTLPAGDLMPAAPDRARVVQQRPALVVLVEHRDVAVVDARFAAAVDGSRAQDEVVRAGRAGYEERRGREAAGQSKSQRGHTPQNERDGRSLRSRGT